MMPLRINRLKNDDELDYYYCEMVGHSLCARALASSLKYGTLTEAQRKQQVERIKKTAPRELRSLNKLYDSPAALFYPDGSPKKSDSMNAKYKKEVQLSSAHQNKVATRQTKACDRDPKCTKHKKGREYCDKTGQQRCTLGTKESYRDAVESKKKDEL